MPAKEDAALRAEENFKKKERQLKEGAKAMADYQAQIKAARDKTARLRALRLAKEAADLEAAATNAATKKSGPTQAKP
jgi:hypothetical protein